MASCCKGATVDQLWRNNGRARAWSLVVIENGPKFTEIHLKAFGYVQHQHHHYHHQNRFRYYHVGVVENGEVVMVMVVKIIVLSAMITMAIMLMLVVMMVIMI